jgi:peptidoglycan/LPS O-acetylase OafA/YrhL
VEFVIITSIVPFVSMVSLFVMTGYVFSVLPPYRTVVAQVIAKKSFSSELEGLRGLLAFSVVIHHSVVWYLLLYYGSADITGPNANLYGQLGVGAVTMFFFITGFLFWSKLIANPKPNFKSFVVSRLRRLGPAYLGAFGFLIVLVAALTHFQLHTSPATLVRDLLHILWADTPLLNGLSIAPWLWGVTWTLRFECLFYLMIPFVGWFAGTLRKSLLFVGVCGLLCVLNRAVRAVHFIPPGFDIYEGFVRYLFSTFSVGIISAQLVHVPRIKTFGRSLWAALIAVAVLAVNLYFVPAKYGYLESLSLAFPFFVVACGCSFWGILRSRAVLFLGQISYSVYLIHPLIFGAVLIPLYRMRGSAMQTPRAWWTVLFLMAPAIVGVATLWHRMFELPFLMKNAKIIGPPDRGIRPSPLRPAYVAAGGAPVLQSQMRTIAFGGEAHHAADGVASATGNLAPVRRASFLPQRLRRTESIHQG